MCGDCTPIILTLRWLKQRPAFKVGLGLHKEILPHRTPHPQTCIYFGRNQIVGVCPGVGIEVEGRVVKFGKHASLLLWGNLFVHREDEWLFDPACLYAPSDWLNKELIGQ